MSSRLLEILVCPLCKGDLIYDEKNSELICHESKLAYQIKDGIPVMLVEEARKLEL
ncbi:MAG: Trm112 family protein [Rickettsiales bacterium]|nr:Trm112 family protein [Rickettsiales bacterium]